MPSNDVSVVLVHGAWADGSSWAKVIAPLAADGIEAVGGAAAADIVQPTTWRRSTARSSA